MNHQLQEIIKIAAILDENGLYKEADQITALLHNSTQKMVRESQVKPAMLKDTLDSIATQAKQIITKIDQVITPYAPVLGNSLKSNLNKIAQLVGDVSVMGLANKTAQSPQRRTYVFFNELRNVQKSIQALVGYSHSMLTKNQFIIGGNISFANEGTRKFYTDKLEPVYRKMGDYMDATFNNPAAAQGNLDAGAQVLSQQEAAKNAEKTLGVKNPPPGQYVVSMPDGTPFTYAGNQSMAEMFASQGYKVTDSNGQALKVTAPPAGQPQQSQQSQQRDYSNPTVKELTIQEAVGLAESNGAPSLLQWSAGDSAKEQMLPEVMKRVKIRQKKYEQSQQNGAYNTPMVNTPIGPVPQDQMAFWQSISNSGPQMANMGNAGNAARWYQSGQRPADYPASIPPGSILKNRKQEESQNRWIVP